MANSITFDTGVLPDCFVGVPYFVGIPYHGASSASGITVASVLTGALPPGLVVKASNDPVVTGTVQVTSQTGTQIDGSYSFTLVLGDSNGTASGAFTMNVHYFPGSATGNADLSVAAQAAIRSGQALDNTAGTMGGVSESGIFPGPSVPTDIG